MQNYFSRKIQALTANKENLQALVFEELDDSQASAVTGGSSTVSLRIEGETSKGFLTRLLKADGIEVDEEIIFR